MASQPLSWLKENDWFWHRIPVIECPGFFVLDFGLVCSSCSATEPHRSRTHSACSHSPKTFDTREYELNRSYQLPKMCPSQTISSGYSPFQSPLNRNKKISTHHLIYIIVYSHWNMKMDLNIGPCPILILKFSLYQYRICVCRSSRQWKTCYVCRSYGWMIADIIGKLLALLLQRGSMTFVFFRKLD